MIEKEIRCEIHNSISTCQSKQKKNISKIMIVIIIHYDTFSHQLYFIKNNFYGSAMPQNCE